MAKAAVNKKAGTTLELSPEQEAMRLQVVDLELKARYWKAQFEIRHFTLEAEKIQEPYNVYLEEMKTKNAELQAKFEEEMAKLKEKGAEVIEPEIK